MGDPMSSQVPASPFEAAGGHNTPFAILCMTPLTPEKRAGIYRVQEVRD